MLKKLAGKLRASKEFTLSHTTDIHSHLIPDIDDGVKSFDESISIIKQYQDLGFKKIITTPHTMSHRFPNTKSDITQGYTRLQEELFKQGIDVELQVASEYYYDEHFLELIEKKDLMAFGGNYILFELSYTVKPFVLEQTVDKLIKAGYNPILAHPERYTYYRTEEHYKRLKEMGLNFQINLISTQGFYGKKVKKAVEKIIDLGLVDFIGSDIHAQNYMDTFSQALQSKSYAKIMKNSSVKNDYL